jgi:tRNA1(Val) A37 N6-methylase TrmN6
MPSPSTRADGPDSRPQGTTRDDFLGGRVTVLQPKQGHRAGSDAVWLQAAVEPRAGSRVLDAGAGVGVAGLCLLSRYPALELTAVEIDPALAALAKSNAARNGVAAKVTVITADVTAAAEGLCAKGLVREGYDQVMANPPYHREGAVRAAPDPGRASAHVMQEGGLGAWIRFFATMAAPKGIVTVIHRSDALTELLPLLARSFGGISAFPLFPKAGEAATRVVVRAEKGSRAGFELRPGLVLHELDGRYTAKAEAVLRGGEGLDFGR